jgi:hypothetical protein
MARGRGGGRAASSRASRGKGFAASTGGTPRAGRPRTVPIRFGRGGGALVRWIARAWRALFRRNAAEPAPAAKPEDMPPDGS